MSFIRSFKTFLKSSGFFLFNYILAWITLPLWILLELTLKFLWFPNVPAKDKPDKYLCKCPVTVTDFDVEVEKITKRAFAHLDNVLGCGDCAKFTTGWLMGLYHLRNKAHKKVFEEIWSKYVTKDGWFTRRPKYLSDTINFSGDMFCGIVYGVGQYPVTEEFKARLQKALIRSITEVNYQLATINCKKHDRGYLARFWGPTNYWIVTLSAFKLGQVTATSPKWKIIWSILYYLTYVYTLVRVIFGTPVTSFWVGKYKIAQFYPYHSCMFYVVGLKGLGVPFVPRYVARWIYKRMWYNPDIAVMYAYYFGGRVDLNLVHTFLTRYVSDYINVPLYKSIYKDCPQVQIGNLYFLLKPEHRVRWETYYAYLVPALDTSVYPFEKPLFVIPRNGYLGPERGFDFIHCYGLFKKLAMQR